MTSLLRIIFPDLIVHQVKLFTGEIRERSGKEIRQFNKNDRRYRMLQNLHKIKQLRASVCSTDDMRGSVWFKSKQFDKNVVISVYYDKFYYGYIWEMFVLGKGDPIRLRIR
jgi:hypothetical protein